MRTEEMVNALGQIGAVFVAEGKRLPIGTASRSSTAARNPKANLPDLTGRATARSSEPRSEFAGAGAQEGVCQPDLALRPASQTEQGPREIVRVEELLHWQRQRGLVAIGGEWPAGESRPLVYYRSAISGATWAGQ